MASLPQNNQTDLQYLANRIDVLIETLNKRFDDVRLEMRTNMEKYVLTAVHDLEIKRLDEKDAEQQIKLNELEQRAFSAPQRWLIYLSTTVGAIGGLLGILHLLHLL